MSSPASTTPTCTALSPSVSSPTPCYYRLTVPTFLMGAMIALFSQFVLQYIFYGVNTNFIQHLLYSSTNATALSMCKVILFSISWSLMTCVIVFLGMVASMHFLESMFVLSVPTTTATATTTTTDTNKNRIHDNDEDVHEEKDDEDATLFAMEISYVFGAIAAIILLWTVFDFGLVIYPSTTVTSSNDHRMNIDHSFTGFLYQSPLCVIVVSLMITILVFSTTSAIIHLLRCLYQKHTANRQVDTKGDVEDVEESIAPTTLSLSPSPVEWFIYCIASTVGLMVGMGTQMILSLMLWSNVDHIPFVVQSNITIALFSFGWSAVTVVVTAFACYLLRRIVLGGIVPHCMHRNTSFHYQSLLIVRMEAMYIGWTLTGICIGWIVLDIVHHMASQIYISILLFILSISSFGCILYYFPEQSITSADDDDDENDMNENTLTEPLLLLTEDLQELA